MEKQRRWIWQGAVVLAVVALTAIFVFRANPPKERSSIQRERISYTSGTFIESPQTIEAGGYLNFKFVLNGRKTLNGKFTTAGYKGKIECVVVDEKNFELFKSGREFQKIVSTSSIPGGKIGRVFEPGTYFVVFDNRIGTEKIDLAESEFAIE